MATEKTLLSRRLFTWIWIPFRLRGALEKREVGRDAAMVALSKRRFFAMAGKVAEEFEVHALEVTR